MSVSMENGFPKKSDEEGLPEHPQGLFKSTAQLLKDLCPILKPFSPIATATVGKRKGKEKVTQVFSAIHSMHPRTSTNTGVGCIYGSNSEQKPLLKVGDCHGGKALSSQEEKAGTQQDSRRYLGKDFFTLLHP